MSVASSYTLCFVMFCVFLYGPFCHGAHKLDLSTLFTTCFSLNISSIYTKILNWWKGKPSGSIACTRKQQPLFYWSCSSVVMNDATPLTPPSAWAELHFQMLTTYMYTPWSPRTRKIWLHKNHIRGLNFRTIRAKHVGVIPSSETAKTRPVKLNGVKKLSTPVKEI